MIKKITFALVIIMILALLLCFKPIADVVAKPLGIAADKLTYWAKIVLVTAIGLYLVTTGVAALVVPWVGIALIVIGLALITYAWWPFFKKTEQPSGTKL
mgnify:CR=1 FL=1